MTVNDLPLSGHWVNEHIQQTGPRLKLLRVLEWPRVAKEYT